MTLLPLVWSSLAFIAGIMLGSRVQDDNELVDAVFESVGIKLLAASLTNLNVIKG
jgi:hypothetical protein